MRTIAALFLSFSLLGCSATPTQVSTFYDYQLATPLVSGSAYRDCLLKSKTLT